LVLGDIGELGDSAAEEHQALGLNLAQLPVDAIFAVGQYAQALAAGHAERAFTDKDQLLAALLAWLASQRQTAQGAPINILFKGSRFMQMESLIAGLEAAITADLPFHPTAHPVAETH
jgi:UDP-N-acetylmuramoyl-tripeptide--D-alanyl-D-alanine ligase